MGAPWRSIQARRHVAVGKLDEKSRLLDRHPNRISCNQVSCRRYLRSLTVAVLFEGWATHFCVAHPPLSFR